MPNFSHSPDLILSRYLAAELLAYTVWRLFPSALLKGGGVNSLGFFYDFILDQALTDSLLEMIEVELRTFIKGDQEVRPLSMMRENAHSLFLHQGQPLLAQCAREESQNIVTLIQIEGFYGLCPELPFTSTQSAGHIRLLDCQDRTDEWQEKGKVHLRLIGTNQKTAQDLKHFIKAYDLFLKKRDHRILGPQLNLFSWPQETGEFGPFWHPKGHSLRQILKNWLQTQLREENTLSTPTVLPQEFLKKEPLLLEAFSFKEEAYCLSPLPLRQHLKFLEGVDWAVEELPYRIAEYASVYRTYPEFQRWGLFCACSDEIDYTTIVCSKEQLIKELISSLLFIEQIVRIFDFEACWYLVASKQKSSQARKEQEALKWLKQVVEGQAHLPYCLDLQEEEENLGPRLELRIQDSLGREWPASTVSVIQRLPKAHAWQMPEKEHLSLVVLARQIGGSLNRFLALLVERCEGKLPFWLAPEQVRILVIGEANQAYAQEVSGHLRCKGLRVKLDRRQTKLSMRVHEAEKENVPYVVLIGEQERLKQKINVRVAGKLHQNHLVELEKFLEKLDRESAPPCLEHYK